MKTLYQTRLVPVVTLDAAEDAVPVAEALIAGGLPIVEITFRTPAAVEAVRRLRQSFGDAVCIGAGTLLTPEQVHQAAEAGAHFGVAPGLNPRTVAAAQAQSLPFIPGVMTPSDIEAALELRCTLLKFFPAEPAGGVRALKAMAAPYAHTGVRFIPLGGVGPANLREYLGLPFVAAIGGSWIAEREAIRAHQWAEITRRASEARALTATPPG